MQGIRGVFFSFTIAVFALLAGGLSGQAQTSNPPVINTSSTWSFGPPALASSDMNGLPGNGGSFHANFSPDGAKVAFWSASTNLVPGTNGVPIANGLGQWYIKDLTTGAIALISADINGVEANNQSFLPNTSSQVLMFSPDGNKVVFNSGATNLAGGATNGLQQIFVKDLTTGDVILVSADVNGLQGNGDSFSFGFSPDGSKVAFHSAATNLLATPTHTTNIFVKDLTTQAVTLVSADATGAEGNDVSSWPIFSPDGAQVAFASQASNLLLGTSGLQIYIKNLQNGLVTLVSSNMTATPNNAGALYPMFSSDGSKVAFASNATNLVPGINSGLLDIYVKELATGAISLASSDAGANEGNNGSLPPVFTPDGARVGFESLATNLIPGGTTTTQVFAKDLLTGAVTLLATNANGDQADAFSTDPNFSAAHTEVAFDSAASNFGAANGGNAEIYVRQIFTTSGTVVDNPSAATLTTAGQVSFSDPDLTDTHRATVSSQAGNLGTLAVNVAQDTAGTGTGGVVTWSYQVSESAVRALSAAASDSFTLTITDSQGCTATTAINVIDLPPDFSGAASAIVTSAPPTSSCPTLTVTSSPASITVPAGESAFFTSAATGSPTPTVQWQVSTDGGASFSNIAQATTTVLNFFTAQISQNGNLYRAVFTNPSGSVTTNAAQLTVIRAPSFMFLLSVLNPPVFGQPVTFTVFVGSVSQFQPTGTVKFFDGATTLGSAPLDSFGHAAFTTSSLSTGTRSITATYGGDSNFTSSSATLLPPLFVGQDLVTVTILGSPNSILSGQPVSFSATVAAAPPGAGTPTGTVTFLDGATPLGTAALANGQASLTAPLSVAGSHSVTARYNADSNFSPGVSPSLSQTVNLDPSVTVLRTSANPAVFGQQVTFTVSVTATAPGAGTPTGPVSFQDGAATLATSNLINGQATLSLSTLASGSHFITATYAGDGSFGGSSATLTQLVGPAPTLTSIASSANPSILNQTVTLTATVSVAPPNTGVPTGSVTFKDGSAVLGTVSLSTTATAVFTTASLAVGPHSLTAVYSGDAFSAASTSAIFVQNVQYAQAGGSCDGAPGHQILPPIDPAGGSVLKQGRTVPAIFRVCDGNGVSIGTPGVVSSFLVVQIINGTSTANVQDVVDTNNPDTAFRWDPLNQQWIFNIATGNLAAGNTYVFAIALNDGTVIGFQYGLR